MNSSTLGLILKAVKYSDTSLILTVYTRELGLQAYMMRGVRGGKRKKGNILQPMNFLEMEVTSRENKNLQSMREFKPAIVYSRIPFDMKRTAMGMFMLEVINACIREEEANHELFDFLYSAFQYLDVEEELSPLFHLKFMVQLSGHLGFMPMTNYDGMENNLFALEAGYFISREVLEPHVLGLEMSKLFYDLVVTPVRELKNMQVNKIYRQELLEVLEQYYKLHIMDFKDFRTPMIFEQIFG